MLIRQAAQVEEFTAGDGTLLRELLRPGTGLSLRYSLAQARLAPGFASQPHRLSSSEVYIILLGAGIMHVDNETAHVGAGTVVYIPPRCVQHIENSGEEELLFLCIVDPAWRPEDEEVC